MPKRQIIPLSYKDALFPWVENDTVILIGATTENLYFEIDYEARAHERECS